jgi:hypothetical protein
MRAIRSMFRNDPPRWRVAILEADSSSRAVLRAAVEDAGGVVAVEAPLRLDAVAVMKETRADVVIMAPSLCGTRDCASRRARLSVITVRATPIEAWSSGNRGVMGFMLKPLRSANAPTLGQNIARFRSSATAAGADQRSWTG